MDNLKIQADYVKLRRRVLYTNLVNLEESVLPNPRVNIPLILTFVEVVVQMDNKKTNSDFVKTLVNFIKDISDKFGKQQKNFLFKTKVNGDKYFTVTLRPIVMEMKHERCNTHVLRVLMFI